MIHEVDILDGWLYNTSYPRNGSKQRAMAFTTERTGSENTFDALFSFLWTNGRILYRTPGRESWLQMASRTHLPSMDPNDQMLRYLGGGFLLPPYDLGIVPFILLALLPFLFPLGAILLLPRVFE